MTNRYISSSLLKYLCTFFFLAGFIFSAQAQYQVNNNGYELFGGAFPKYKTSETTKKYWIYFIDKSGSAFNKNNPTEFLAQRALDRRAKSNIAITSSDLPVSTIYINNLAQLGIVVDVQSRWLNAVSANLTEKQREDVSSLTCVKKITSVAKYKTVDDNSIPFNNNVFYKTAQGADITGPYGFAGNQIEQINLDTILELGYTGNDMVIAVLDAGFFGLDTATLFQSFWDKGQILGFHNFPDDNDQVFNIYSGYHGSWVTSVIGGDIEDVYSGSAPDLKFFLFRTEVADSEYVVEEDYWLEAAELADYIGVDLINSSLGYTEFDDSTENHTYADLDGNTSVITKAADMAASKGILVCNSAGNEGGNSWHYISMPSDGDSVFCIGAVDTNGVHVGFSGYGPTSDGRIKPNVVALGLGSSVLDPNGSIVNLSGTSFSSPLMAGACASLWSAFPYRTNMEIIDAVQQSASLYLTPNDTVGYGIPNFGLAYEILKAQAPEDTVIIIDTTTVSITVLPNPASDVFSIFIASHLNQNALLQITNITGEILYTESLILDKNSTKQSIITIDSKYPTGLYFVSLITNMAKQSAMVFVK